jgi:hypothetical protein
MRRLPTARLVLTAALALAGISHNASAQTTPVLQLPAGPLTKTTVPGVTASVVETVATIQFTVTFSGLQSGLSVKNQSYSGYCPDLFGDFNLNNTVTPYTPYSTYNTSALPTNAQSANWPAVNWVLNHQPTGSQSTWIVQQVIWRLLSNQYGLPAYTPATGGYPTPQPATDNLYNQALAQGANFVPGPGQVVGVIMYIDGIYSNPAVNGLPPNGQSNVYQDVLIEVPVPTGAIGDFVWQDTNHNGIQDAGEPGINGVTVRYQRN